MEYSSKIWNTFRKIHRYHFAHNLNVSHNSCSDLNIVCQQQLSN